MAIKVEDLRVNNEVLYFETISTVVQIDGFNNLIGLAGWEKMTSPENIEPVPLDSDILIKCGFIDEGVSVDSNWYYKLVSIPTNHMNVTYEFGLFSTEEKGKYGVNLEEQYLGYCQYLHQLMNLFYAITNTEIEYKP